MTGKKLRQYLFKSGPQWRVCLSSLTDDEALHAESVLRPLKPYTGDPICCDSPGARTPVVLRTGEILWSGDDGMLQRGCTGGETSEAFPAPPSIARASRVVSAAAGLWVKNPDRETLEYYDEETLALLITVDLQNARIIDIAGGDRDTLLVLVERNGELQSIRFSCSGHELDFVSLTGIAPAEAKAFVFLRRSQRFVVFAGGRHPSLTWYAAEGGEPVFSRTIVTLLPCFKAELLGSDSKERIVLAGREESESAHKDFALVLDADGTRFSQVPLAEKATGITATRQNVIVTDARGLCQYAAAEVVPHTTEEVACRLITPMLQSLDLEDSSPWLRIEAHAALPEGTTLEIGYAASDDPKVCERQKTTAADVRLPTSRRIHQLLGDPDLEWITTTFHGSAREPAESAAAFSAPLFDVSKRYLWVSVRLTASPGAKLPALKQLSVLYPGRSLVEHLPTPYRRAAAEPGDFLRSLVGVLETTTQDLDARIAALGSHIHPETATGEWMDYLARWLSLPWDDALTETQKQSILRNAPDLARGRGTRAGLETLLECLLPGLPRRFRVTDATADVGFAVVGGDQCAGSTLPAMLGGFTRWHAELNTNAVLGYTRLRCANQRDDRAQWLGGRIRVEIAVEANERKAFEPWLLAIVTEMAPLNTRVELRWVSSFALRTDRLDDVLVLEAPLSPHLGTDAVTGLARLPEPRRTRLTSSGPAVGSPLR